MIFFGIAGVSAMFLGAVFNGLVFHGLGFTKGQALSHAEVEMRSHKESHLRSSWGI